MYIYFEITRSGQPMNIRVEQSSGIPSLDQSAVRAPYSALIRSDRCRRAIRATMFQWSSGLIIGVEQFTRPEQMRCIDNGKRTLDPDETIRHSLLAVLRLTAVIALSAQDWIRTGTGLGVEKIRLAVPDFKMTARDTGTQEPDHDLQHHAVERSAGGGHLRHGLARASIPWPCRARRRTCSSTIGTLPPPNANMLAFGNIGVQGGSLEVQGWLFDVKNAQSPQVLGKQYREAGQRRQRPAHRASLRR